MQVIRSIDEAAWLTAASQTSSLSNGAQEACVCRGLAANAPSCQALCRLLVQRQKDILQRCNFRCPAACCTNPNGPSSL